MADSEPVTEDRPSSREGQGSGERGGGAQDKPKQQEPKPKPARWPWLVAAVVILGFIGFTLYKIYAPKPDVWTDDAYVRVHYATVASRVAGQVNTVPVDDNQAVTAGQVLTTLDPRDSEQAVASAQAALDRDLAEVGDVEANLARQPALIAEQEAALDSARAQLTFAEQNRHRYGNLAATGAGTVQERQQAETQLQQDTAAIRRAQSSLDATRQQTEVLRQQRAAAQGTVAADQARLAQAKLNLSYTTITAPLAGLVTERAVQVGNIVAPGATLMVIVPLQAVYIQANYRETDLRHVRRGQHATIHLDAYDVDLDGIVDSVAPASGATFSPIPPNNATGNFTKIVQRLPVKLVLSPGQNLASLLRAGFSVETTIHTGLADVVAEERASPGPLNAH